VFSHCFVFVFFCLFFGVCKCFVFSFVVLCGLCVEFVFFVSFCFCGFFFVFLGIGCGCFFFFCVLFVFLGFLFFSSCFFQRALGELVVHNQHGLGLGSVLLGASLGVTLCGYSCGYCVFFYWHLSVFLFIVYCLCVFDFSSVVLFLCFFFFCIFVFVCDVL